MASEEGRLYFCRGAVDFIGEYEVGENRAFLYLESLALDAVYHCADNVARQKVGGKLYTAVFCVDELRECLNG